ncbi:hypothetical protein RhiirA5_441207 [Rhizophagus irregularis]|uniref:Uncharacterized protein n=1 Tax=Rhizophagus irregularis TaxID=588596 RepID=A0A2N0NFV4_9GLOM|nr:hypothetical protein RhiirA5_441207 [Rhizophagus irregularis]
MYPAYSCYSALIIVSNYCSCSGIILHAQQFNLSGLSKNQVIGIYLIKVN